MIAPEKLWIFREGIFKENIEYPRTKFFCRNWKNRQTHNIVIAISPTLSNVEIVYVTHRCICVGFCEGVWVFPSWRQGASLEIG